MKFTRRKFIKLGGIAAITTIGLSNNSFSFSFEDQLASLSLENFQQLIGEQFIILNEVNSYSATLVNVKDFATNQKHGVCFSMEFSVDSKNLRQSTYDVFHPNIGNFQLFMTEGKRGKAKTLIAIINRI